MGCGGAFQPRPGQNARRTGTPVKEYLPLPLLFAESRSNLHLYILGSIRKEWSPVFDLNHH
jgi:hypothetical protein